MDVMILIDTVLYLSTLSLSDVVYEISEVRKINESNPSIMKHLADPAQ